MLGISWKDRPKAQNIWQKRVLVHKD